MKHLRCPHDRLKNMAAARVKWEGSLKKNNLVLGPGIELPPDTAVHRVCIIGTYNSGKSYGAMKMAEQMYHAGTQFVALDPMGIWWGMRLSADQKKEGMAITIFGGAHADIPVTENDGGLVADVIVGEGISAIIDTSQFETDAERIRFAHRFAERFYWLKKERPSAVHLFLEEAHEYVPQNVQPGEATMLAVFNRIWKQGGNYGIGGTLITQRPQDVNKKALELSALVLAFNTTGSNAVDAVTKWMKGAVGIEQLVSLPTGSCLVWSPSWLRIQQVGKIAERETYHARFDPSKPVKLPEVRTLGDKAIAKIREAFTQAVVDFKENDPKELKKKVQQLEAQLANQKPEPCAKCAQLEAAIHECDMKRYEFGTTVGQLIEDFCSYSPTMNRLPQGVALAVESSPVMSAPTVLERRRSAAVKIEAPRPPAEGLTQTQQALLDAAALLEEMGEPRPLFQHVAIVAGKGPNSGPVRAQLRQLVEGGDIEQDGKNVQLTEQGRSKARRMGFKTLEELHGHWLSTKKGLVRDILEVVIAAAMVPMGLAELGTAIGKNINSGPVRMALNEAINTGLIEWVGGKDNVAATPLLFPAPLMKKGKK